MSSCTLASRGGALARAAVSRLAASQSFRMAGPPGSLHFGPDSIWWLPSACGRRSLGEVQLVSPWTQKMFSSSASTSSKNEEETTAQAEGGDKPGEEEAGSAAGSAAAEREEQLVQQIKQLESKHADLLDKYRRSLAESDNLRKRLTKQIEDAKVFGIQSFCKDLLDVADVLSKAASEVTEEALQRESQYLRDVHQGLRLTEAELLQVFKRHGLERVAPQVGDKFDPNVHEALFQGPAPDGVEAGAVIDVQKVGYALSGRTIRPALVGVAKK